MDESYRSYPQRWLILSVFSVLACHQCLIWNTWGPVELSVKYAYDWSDLTVAAMANWGTLMFMIGVVPLSYLLELKGLRTATLVAAALVAAGTVLRYFYYTIMRA